MRTTEWINLTIFSFFTIAAWLRPPTTSRSRLLITIIGAAGIALIIAVQFADQFLPSRAVSMIRDWLPAPLMPMVYWQTGRFAGKPNQHFQNTLHGFDRRWLGSLLQTLAAKRSYRLILDCLELAYLSCYVLVPLGLGMLYLAGMRKHAEEYWLVILTATYPCYVFTGFVPTLPPRVIEKDSKPFSSTLRTFNLWIVRHASIHLNTFPSAHVTATLGGSLVLARYKPSIGFPFLLISIGIVIGAVTGRYHYLADVLVAAALTIAIFGLKVFV
jgi:hypothetical protein